MVAGQEQGRGEKVTNRDPGRLSVAPFIRGPVSTSSLRFSSHGRLVHSRSSVASSLEFGVATAQSQATRPAQAKPWRWTRACAVSWLYLCDAAEARRYCDFRRIVSHRARPASTLHLHAEGVFRRCVGAFDIQPRSLCMQAQPQQAIVTAI